MAIEGDNTNEIEDIVSLLVDIKKLLTKLVVYEAEGYEFEIYDGDVEGD